MGGRGGSGGGGGWGILSLRGLAVTGPSLEEQSSFLFFHHLVEVGAGVLSISDDDLIHVQGFSSITSSIFRVGESDIP